MKILTITFYDMLDENRQLACDMGAEYLNGFTHPFAVVTDLRMLTDMPAKQRAMYAAAREAVRENYKRYHVITVYVVRDAGQHGLLTAIGWISKAESTSGRVFADSVADALRLCQAALDERRRSET